MRKLPPLAAVRVFEAAARYENFTAAARELEMTQAAVSHQISLIEAHLGQQLFRRECQRVILTDAARRAAADLGKGFDMIETAFANAWLAWRIGRFQMRYPDLAVRLLMQEGLVDLSGDGVDVAVRSGYGMWPDVRVHHLMEQDFTPMCSQGFLAGQGGHLAPGDLLRLPLISPQDPSWTCWFQQAGLAQDKSTSLQGIRMDSQANEGHAAMAGQGVAMLTPFFWHRDMAEKRLVQLFP